MCLSLAGECASVKLSSALCDDDSSSNEVLPDMEVKPDQRAGGLDKAKDLSGDLGKQLSHSIYSPFSRILTYVFFCILAFSLLVRFFFGV